MYMSPEQVKDSKHIDYHTDNYSLAVTFVHLITGKRPYDSDTYSDFEISERIVYHPLDLSGLPREWQQFLAPYLEKDPQKRPDLKPFSAVSSIPSLPQFNADDEATVLGDSTPAPAATRQYSDEETFVDGGQAAAAPVAEKKTQTGSVNLKAKFCRKCGTALSLQAKFCRKCGNKRRIHADRANLETKFCRKCGIATSPEAKFCKKCGNKLIKN